MRGNWAFAPTLNEPDWVSDSVLLANKRSAVAPSMNEADLGFVRNTGKRFLLLVQLD